MICKRVDLIRSAPPASADVDDAMAHDPAEAGDADIVADRLLADQAVAAILRHQPEAERHGIVGSGDRDPLAVDQDLAVAAVPG